MKPLTEKHAQSQGAVPVPKPRPRMNEAACNIPPEMLEDALLRMAGLAAGPSCAVRIERSVAAFEADPLGPYTDSRLDAFFSLAECAMDTDGEAVRNGLRRIFAAVETVPQAAERKALAEKAAAGIYAWAQSVDPAQRNAVDEMLGPLVLRPTAVGKRYNRILMDRSPVSIVGKAPEAPSEAGTTQQPAGLGSHRARGARPPNGDTLVYYRVVHRDGKEETEEAVPKEFHEEMLKGAEEKMVPKSRKPKIIASIVVAASLVLGAVAIKCFPELRVAERVQALTVRRETIIEKFRGAVTLKDEVRIKSREVISKNKHDGPLSLQQIFDIYDYVSSEVKYQSDSHPLFPQPDYLTLKAKGGDCKSKTVLLASMLEAVGAETVMYAITYQNDDGHAVVGVRITQGTSGESEKVVSALIEKRYGKNIAARLGGKKLKPLFRKIYSPSGFGTYLILDSAVMDRQDAIPGRTAGAYPIKSEIDMRARPGIPGNNPEIL